jgi:uncharacterized protein (DUF924 family)
VVKPEEILSYWLDEVGPQGWYRGGEALDAEIRERFLPLWEQAQRGELRGWLSSPEHTLAYLILVDQFPRNMFRNDERAYATDFAALAAAKCAISKGWDQRIAEPARQFFYLPLMHAESQMDQDRCVRMMLIRMPETGLENLKHAIAHREIIRRFGRFPFRNDALHRVSTATEVEFENEGGYGAVLRAVRMPERLSA